MKKEEISLFDMFSPSDYRYSVTELRPYLSEEAYVKYKSKVEAALARVLAKRKIISARSAEKIVEASEKVTASDVYDEESRTQHDVIAQVNVIRNLVSKEAKTGVHRTATSYDIIDSANAMRYRDAFVRVIIPDMIELEKVWIESARKWKDTLQIGRTHLQHAEPITFGFSIAWYVSRFGNDISKLMWAVRGLNGKFAGAVGAYNASSLFVDNPEDFEKEILREVGLNPSEISTQIVQPESMNDIIHRVVSSFTILANWADDMRNLQRPEIAEVGQPRGKDISRSSTMPHKANPVGLENIKSLWKATMPSVIMMHLDQISDHQRDLTNSASQRYIPQILDQFDYSVRRAIRISRSLEPNAQNMLKNFGMGANHAIAEPLQLLLAAYGHPDAHAYIGKLADQSLAESKPLIDIVLKDKSLQPYLKQFTAMQMAVIKNPQKYVGIASKKAGSVADSWSAKMKAVEKELS